MAVPWVRFTENALVPKIMLQFQNGDTSWHQGDSAGIFMYSAGIFETFVKKCLNVRQKLGTRNVIKNLKS